MAREPVQLSWPSILRLGLVQTSLGGVVVLMAPALLTALVVTSALADGDRLHLGADTVGVAVGGLVLWRRGPLVVAVLAAVVVTALLRLSGWLG